MRTVLAAAAALLIGTADARAGVFAFSDSTSDLLGAGPVQHDIVSYETQYNATETAVTFVIEFAGPVQAASAFGPNSVIGYIDIDTDFNAATGGTAPWGASVAGGNSWVNHFANTDGNPARRVTIGSEFYLDLGSELFTPGFVGLYRTSDNAEVGLAEATYNGNVMSVTVSTAALGRPYFSYAVVAGTFGEQTDQAPDGGVAAISTPAPSGVILAVVGGLSLLGGRRLRRRA
jgi:hypothetical protein